MRNQFRWAACWWKKPSVFWLLARKFKSAILSLKCWRAAAKPLAALPCAIPLPRSRTKLPMRKLLLRGLPLSACGQNTATRDYSQQGAVADGDMYVSAALGEGSNLVWFLSGDSASHE